jgi:Tfp pilus assembly protein PilO
MLMGTGHGHRLWAIGGALAAAVLVAVGWFLFISPQNSQTTDLRARTAAAQQRITSLNHRLGELRQQNTDLARYQAELARDREALPKESALSNFLRELQDAGDSAGISVSGLVVGVPVPATEGGGAVFALPVSVTALGTEAKLNGFLDQLQQVQPRAVLITSANAIPNEGSGSLAGTVSLTLTMQVFTAPENAAAATGTAKTPAASKTK